MTQSWHWPRSTPQTASTAPTPPRKFTPHTLQCNVRHLHSERATQKQAEALRLQGNTTQAEAVLMDSLGWARYGFGQDVFVQGRLNEIRALRPF